MREGIEVFELGEVALNLDGVTTIRDQIPLAEGFYTMFLHFDHNLTTTTASGPKVEGELGIVKSIRLTTDRDGVVVNNVAGRGLYKAAHLFEKTAPAKTAIAATTGHYYAAIPIVFASFERNRRPEDTILNTKWYNVLELAFTMGGVADLFSTVGDASLASSVRVVLVRSKGILTPQELGKGRQPLALPYFTQTPTINPANQTYIDLDRSRDLAIHQILVFTANSSTGEPFSGTAADNVISRLKLETDRGYPFPGLTARVCRDLYKSLFNIESWPVGCHLLDLCLDRSFFSNLSSGKFAKLRLSWDNDTLSTSGVTALIRGARDFKDRKYRAGL